MLFLFTSEATFQQNNIVAVSYKQEEPVQYFSFSKNFFELPKAPEQENKKANIYCSLQLSYVLLACSLCDIYSGDLANLGPLKPQKSKPKQEAIFKHYCNPLSGT